MPTQPDRVVRATVAIPPPQFPKLEAIFKSVSKSRVVTPDEMVRTCREWDRQMEEYRKRSGVVAQA